MVASLGPNKSIVVVGDFNVLFGENQANAQHLEDTMGGFALHITIFVNIMTEVLSSEVVDLDISDHKGQVIDFLVSMEKSMVVQTQKVCKPITQQGSFTIKLVFSMRDLHQTNSNINSARFFGVAIVPKLQ